jgi:hypothetical protein
MRRYRVASRALDELVRTLVRHRVFVGDETARSSGR